MRTTGGTHVWKHSPRNDGAEGMDRINLYACNGIARPRRVGLATILGAAMRCACELAVLAAGHLRAGSRDRRLGARSPQRPAEGRGDRKGQQANANAPTSHYAVIVPVAHYCCQIVVVGQFESTPANGNEPDEHAATIAQERHNFLN
jgi:hypothetical protein